MTNLQWLIENGGLVMAPDDANIRPKLIFNDTEKERMAGIIGVLYAASHDLMYFLRKTAGDKGATVELITHDDVVSAALAARLTALDEALQKAEKIAKGEYSACA